MTIFKSPWAVRCIWIFAMLFVVMGATATCAFIGGAEGTWRYKMTVTVDTPEGVKTGSVVREVHADQGNIKISPHGVARVKVKGEAVVVDLGARGSVFALLRGDIQGVDYGDAVVYTAFPPPAGIAPLTNEGIRYYIGLKETPPVTLSPGQRPMFVRFRDPSDPKTVEAVKPDDFATSFGEGVSLKSVTIEMTREPVTTGVVERYLPKFSRDNPMSIPGESLFPSDFRKKDK